MLQILGCDRALGQSAFPIATQIISSPFIHQVILACLDRRL